MISTTEELINSTNLTFDDWEVIKELMLEFAKEAIKADRLNLLKHAEVYFDEGTNLENVHIDKDSIINAPMIELK